MAVTKPDATAFDSADDSIADARAELYTLATSFNTIADEYNAGTLGGAANLVAGNGVTLSNPDSAGSTQIDADKSNFGATGLATTLTSTGTQNVTATNAFSHVGINTVSTNAITVVLNIDAMEENQEFYLLIEPYQGSNHGTLTVKFESTTDSWTSAGFTATVATLYSVQKFAALQSASYVRMYAAQQINNIDTKISV